MNDLARNLEDEKTRLTEKLSDQYARSTISIDEYERLIDYINKIETKKEISVVENMIQGYSSDTVSEEPDDREVFSGFRYGNAEHVAVFSSHVTNLEPVNGKSGKFISIFGAHKIFADRLPPGKTVIKLECVFGSVEIVVSHSTRVINRANSAFCAVNMPGDSGSGYGFGSELVIKGDMVFGNLNIIRK